MQRQGVNIFTKNSVCRSSEIFCWLYLKLIRPQIEFKWTQTKLVVIYVRLFDVEYQKKFFWFFKVWIFIGFLVKLRFSKYYTPIFFCYTYSTSKSLTYMTTNIEWVQLNSVRDLMNLRWTQQKILEPCLGFHYPNVYLEVLIIISR